MRTSAGKSKRFCDTRHASPRARLRRLWHADMLDALMSIVGDDGVENDWARERVRKLLGDAAKPPEPEMHVILGDVSLTVRGHGMALLLAPGLLPDKDDDLGSSGRR